jgi:hypothetical protein
VKASALHSSTLNADLLLLGDGHKLWICSQCSFLPAHVTYFLWVTPSLVNNISTKSPLSIITTLHYHRAVVEHKASGRKRIPIFDRAEQHTHTHTHTSSTEHIRSDADISCGRPLANVNLMGFLPALNTPTDFCWTRRTNLPFLAKYKTESKEFLLIWSQIQRAEGLVQSAPVMNTHSYEQQPSEFCGPPFNSE